MGSPKTVDRNAMTFVPIGWNVVLWGVKTRLELGQGIGEDGEEEQISEPNARQASQNPEAATEEPEPAAPGLVQEYIRRSGELNDETNGRTRGEITQPFRLPALELDAGAIVNP